MSDVKLKKILEPGYIGKIKTRNRMVKTGAHHGWFPYNDGHVDSRCCDFYEALVQGGIGSVTVCASNIDYPIGLGFESGFRFDDDKYIKGHAKYADVMHKYNCPAFMQLMHSGPLFRGKAIGFQPISASSIPQNESPKPTLAVAHEMTISEVEAMVERFIGAALRAQKAGFDGIELNAGYCHLLNSFLSRAWNRRRDAYGADSLESRTKIMTDIIKGIKQRAGQDFVVITLINGAETRLKDGITPQEGQEIAKLMERAGADAIQIRDEYYMRRGVFGCESTHFPDIACYPEPFNPPGELVDVSHHGKAGWIPLAAGVKRVVKIPVIGIGKLDPILGEKILNDGMVDFVSMNRRLFCDPELPNKLVQGRMEDVAPCTGCMTCFEAAMLRTPAICQVNATLGRETELKIKPAEQKKKVVIVGGGPAGLEAARVAALEGHNVILFEKQSRLGGSVNIASIVKGFPGEALLELIRYYKTQMTKLGVDIRLGKEVSESLLKEIKPDVLIIAAGAMHNVPSIPGINRGNVVTSKSLHGQLKKYIRFFGPVILKKLTNYWLPIGKKVVIMGGNIQGCQVAEFLVKRGRQVTIVETGKELGTGLPVIFVKPLLLGWLADKGVTMITEAKYEEITDKGLVITNKQGEKQSIAADTIVTALPLLPDTKLVKSLENAAPKVYSIGDCQEPALILSAIAAGARVAREI
jgi:2,4-dienoyl-CoA reductase (NADPH2)